MKEGVLKDSGGRGEPVEGNGNSPGCWGRLYTKKCRKPGPMSMTTDSGHEALYDMSAAV